MPRFPQVKANVRVRIERGAARGVLDEVARLNEALGDARARPRPAVGHRAGRAGAGGGRDDVGGGAGLCATIAALVRRELG